LYGNCAFAALAAWRETRNRAPGGVDAGRSHEPAQNKASIVVFLRDPEGLTSAFLLVAIL
jgi:hypothetical protein